MLILEFKKLYFSIKKIFMIAYLYSIFLIL